MLERVKCVICGKTIIGESDCPYSCLSCSHKAEAIFEKQLDKTHKEWHENYDI